VAKPILGDPLTGSLPVTRAVHAELMGQKREWPLVPDPMAVTIRQMIPGRVAYVRTRWGIRRWQIRVVNRSFQPGKYRGASYFVGMDQHGFCRSAWVEKVVSVETAQRALAAGKQIKAIGAGQ